MEWRSTLQLLFLVFAGAVNAGKVFNVVDYGASPDGKDDGAKAFLAALNDACGANGSAGVARVVIPVGTFMVRPVPFWGPCRNPMVVQVDGVVRAPTELGVFKNKEWIAFRHVDSLTINGSGVFDGRGGAVWPYKRGNRLPPSLKLLGVSNAEIRGITMADSKFFQMIISKSLHVTVTNVNITAPGDSPNTDGIHIGDSTDIHITQSTIAGGDDCVSIGAGSTNVTVSGVRCGPGHGISVGSLGKYRDDKGVEGIRVENCSFFGTKNGVRIKTWQDSLPLSANNITFSHIVMREVRNPIIIDQEYCPDSCDSDKPPSRVKISNVRYENITGTTATDVAINLFCSSAVPCENIALKDIDLQPLPPTPGLLPTVPLTTCAHVGKATAQGIVFPPPCF